MLRAFQSFGFVVFPCKWKTRSMHFCPQLIPISNPLNYPAEFSSPAVFPRSNNCCSGLKMSASRSESNPDADVASSSSNSSSAMLASTQPRPRISKTIFLIRSTGGSGVIYSVNDFTAHKPKLSFCQSCGGPTTHVIPKGEEKMRVVCSLCGKIYYENPKMVVGCLVEHNNKVLLCKRKIQPSYGLWTLPAGYLEIGESAAEGATRETLEEACAEAEVLSPFAQLDIPRIGQSYIIFRAKLKEPQFSPGPESLECALYSLDEIPFDSLAFSSIYVTLKMYIEDVKAGAFKFHYCTINKRPGSSPSDPGGFVLDHHLHS